MMQHDGTRHVAIHEDAAGLDLRLRLWLRLCAFAKQSGAARPVHFGRPSCAASLTCLVLCRRFLCALLALLAILLGLGRLVRRGTTHEKRETSWATRRKSTTRKAAHGNGRVAFGA